MSFGTQCSVGFCDRIGRDLIGLALKKLYEGAPPQITRDWFSTFRLIRLPNALPAIFGGLKISITLAVVGAIVAEFVGGDAGIGHQLMVANGSMNTPLLFAGVMALTVLGLALFSIIEWLEAFAMPHRDRSAPNIGSGMM